MQIPWIAVMVAALASMVVGAVWYGPLFGKSYMEAMGFSGMSEEQKQSMRKSMPRTYLAQFLASFLMAMVLAILLRRFGVRHPLGGAYAALWLWLGFIFPVKLGDALWGGKKTLFWLGAGNTLLTVLCMGAIISFWL